MTTSIDLMRVLGLIETKATYPATSLTISLTKLVRLLRRPLEFEMRFGGVMGVTFCSTHSVSISSTLKNPSSQFRRQSKAADQRPIERFVRSWLMALSRRACQYDRVGWGRTWPAFKPRTMPLFCLTSFGMIAVLSKCAMNGDVGDGLILAECGGLGDD